MRTGKCGVANKFPILTTKKNISSEMEILNTGIRLFS